MTLKRVLDDLTDHLTYLQEEGETRVDVSPQTLAELRRKAAATPATKAEAAGDGTTETDLPAIAEEVAQCTRCVLHKTRTKTVPGQGNPRPEIMFIGEGPGEDEDRQGLAFVGRAGKLLTKMIEAMGYTREDVFIGNIVKCRPPGNRNPAEDEMTACLPYLRRQIAALKPKVIVTLGNVPLKALLHAERGITKVRGTWMVYEGIDTIPTYHPSYLLRSPGQKKYAWEDLQAVLRKLGKPIPEFAKGK